MRGFEIACRRLCILPTGRRRTCLTVEVLSREPFGAATNGALGSRGVPRRMALHLCRCGCCFYLWCSLPLPRCLWFLNLGDRRHREVPPARPGRWTPLSTSWMRRRTQTTTTSRGRMRRKAVLTGGLTWSCLDAECSGLRWAYYGRAARGLRKAHNEKIASSRARV